MDQSFEVSGDQFLANPAVSTNQSAHQITVMGGQLIFPATTKIIIHCIGVTAQGELNGGSAIIGMDVYLPDGTHYAYQPMNPGQSANIQSDISGLGDTYVRFNSSVMVSVNGGPPIGSVLVSSCESFAALPVVIDQKAIDHDGIFNLTGCAKPSVCFCEGTRILLGDGSYARVEHIRVGQHVMTPQGRKKVLWCGSREVPAIEINQPICIPAGMFGAQRDVWLSPNHLVLLKGRVVEATCDGEDRVWVKAKHLLGIPGVRQHTGGSTIRYYHIMTGAHHVVDADGLPTETLRPGPVALALYPEQQRSEIVMLTESRNYEYRYPVMTNREARAFRELIEYA